MTLITPHLAVGDSEDPVKYERQIDAFLCCAEELIIPQGKPGFHLPLRDGEPIDSHNLDAAFRFLDEQVQAERVVLVYCAAGRSRSLSVMTGYLALRNSKTPHVILRQIRKLRLDVYPSEPTFESVVQYVNEMRWKCR
jgi:protein-tyrosine phosphatase